MALRGGGRQVGAVGTKTKAKIILRLLGSFVGFNRFPLALVLHPMPCAEGRVGPGHCGERAGPEGAPGGQRLLWKGGAGVSRTEGHWEGCPLSLLCPGVWFIFRIGPVCWVEVTFWRKLQVERGGRLAARLRSRPSAAYRGGLVTGSKGPVARAALMGDRAGQGCAQALACVGAPRVGRWRARSQGTLWGGGGQGPKGR